MIKVTGGFGPSLALAALLAAAVACSRHKEPLPTLSSVTTNQLDEKGRKQGPWEIKMEKMTARGVFENGKMDGTWGFYYSNGEKKAEQTFRMGKRDGGFSEWSSTGKTICTGAYSEGRMTGLWTMWDEEGRITLEANYEDGKAHGDCLRRQYTDMRQEPLTYESTWVKGKLKGICRAWYENRQPRCEAAVRNNRVLQAICWESDGEQIVDEPAMGKARFYLEGDRQAIRALAGRQSYYAKLFKKVRKYEAPKPMTVR